MRSELFLLSESLSLSLALLLPAACYDTIFVNIMHNAAAWKKADTESKCNKT